MTEHYKVLVADDDKKQQLITIGFLSEYENEYTIFSAPNGRIACKIAEAELPDIILMDWEMPEMNGIEALAKIKATESTKDIPVIMVTGLSFAEDLEYALDMGAADYIRKPYDKVELVARVKNVLKRQSKLSEYKKRLLQQEETIKVLREKLNRYL